MKKYLLCIVFVLCLLLTYDHFCTINSERFIPADFKITTTSINTFFLKDNGELWGCGANFDGQLGIGNDNSVSVPLKLSVNVDKIIAYTRQTFIIKKDKSLWVSGYYDEKKYLNFTKLCDNVANINDSYILTTDGKVLEKQDDIFETIHTNVDAIQDNGKYLSTNNYKNLLSIEDKILYGISHKKIESVRNSIFLLDNDNNLYDASNGFKNMTLLEKNVNDFWILSSFDKSNLLITTIVKKNDNTLWSMGSNKIGLLGTGDKNLTKTNNFKKITDDVKDVITNKQNRIFVLKNDGMLYGWGDNTMNCISNENIEVIYSPKLIMTKIQNFSCSLESNVPVLFAIKYNKNIVAWGSSLHGVLGVDKREQISYSVEDAKEIQFS